MAHKSNPGANKTAFQQVGTLEITTVFLFLLAFRLVNALSIRTFFQPDEYFQSLEPAWEKALGPDSGAWITWEWREGLRSSVHPLLFAAVYKATALICDFSNLTAGARAEALIAAPKVLQAIIAATGDLFTWRLAQELYGSEDRGSTAALALTVISPWQWFCSVRTLSNSLETTLTVVGLYYWPWVWFIIPSSKPQVTSVSKEKVIIHQRKWTLPAGLEHSLEAAALACILRPTNIIIWATISLALLYRDGDAGKALALTRSAAVSGLTVLVPSICLDLWFYGDWVFPPFKFLYFNVVQSLAVFYGRNRIDYYFTEGLPLLLTTALPFAAVGLWQCLRGSGHYTTDTERQTRFVLATAVRTTVLAMTSIAHKEVRFIFPLLPILHVLAAKPFATFFHPLPFPRSKLRSAILAFIVITNISIAYYVSFVHQRGVIDVLHYLRHEYETKPHYPRSPPNNGTDYMPVLFLMPCHSTPWRSHLVHPEIHGLALRCEPPLNVPLSEREMYVDEADLFYQCPECWLTGNVDITDRNDTVRPWWEYLVFFEQLEPVMENMMNGTTFKECARFFNTHWHDDWRRKGDVVVWCHSPTIEEGGGR
jgi:GPI mannosyltransferase 3